MPAGRVGRGGVRGWAPQILTVLLIWLAWQIVVSLLVQRAPVETAVRVAPSSAQVLSRAAEAEMVAGRTAEARALAELALRASPFDVRALRILGLAVAESDAGAADPLVTLAGNWSLRDDPSHAWLITRRLRQGDYAGAFGHADALARRREDLHPGMFQLFTVAAAADPRAGPFLIARLAPRPNWRAAYLDSLRADARGAQVQAILALGLEKTPGRLADLELQAIYGQWARQGRLPGLRELRRRLGRPGPGPLQDGGFEALAGPQPFAWNLATGTGFHAATSERPEGTGQALFVETDGFSNGVAASQLLLLDPGDHSLAGSVRFDAGAADPRMSWEIRCVESGATVAQWAPRPARDGAGWSRERTDFTVPAEGCTAQWLELKTRRGPRRTTVFAWFDDLQVAPLTAKKTIN